jgi:hypothetical protein
MGRSDRLDLKKELTMDETKAAWPDPQQAPPDAKPIDTVRPQAIVPDAPTIDEINMDGSLKAKAILAPGNPKLKRRDSGWYRPPAAR